VLPLAVTYAAAIEFLYNLRWFGAKLGLENTRKLAVLAGNPQTKLRFIHIAGTNGKGSTAAMLESIYRLAGLRVGLFTSPHLVAFSERIQVNRQLIPENDVARLVLEAQEWLRAGWGEVALRASPLPVNAPHPTALEHPTFFEVVTAMALKYFAEQKCELVLWETGLGGRLDATNIVIPLASVITNIQYDHQKWLGETLASIAAEKAGIIKPGVPVVTGTDAGEALRVLADTAQRNDSAFFVVAQSATHDPPLDTLSLPLMGEHQKMNAAVALQTVRVLNSAISVSVELACHGLERVHWPGRLQLVTRPSGQRILLDGAHNVGGVEMLVNALKQYFPESKPALLLGILQDKDWARMCELLAPLAGRVLLVPVPSERTAGPHGLAEVCARANPKLRVSEYASLSAALADAAEEPFITITGSLYLIGEAMELLHLSPTTPSDERGLNEWIVATQPAR
jgi:dihydrofolate synthase/folylpolyglutamate synthase